MSVSVVLPLLTVRSWQPALATVADRVVLQVDSRDEDNEEFLLEPFTDTVMVTTDTTGVTTDTVTLKDTGDMAITAIGGMAMVGRNDD